MLSEIGVGLPGQVIVQTCGPAGVLELARIMHLLSMHRAVTFRHGHESHAAADSGHHNKQGS